MKPTVANGGSVSTPGSWNLVTSLTGAGGYGSTLGADTGNTNLFVYERTVPAGGLSGNLSITLSGSNISWAFMARLTNTSLYSWDSIAAATGSQTAAGNVNITFGSNPGVTANDYIIGAMCIPTDIGGGTNFSAEAFSQTSVTFGTVTEINEPQSGTGNDIGGFSCRSLVSSGTGSANPVMTATFGTTNTNIRGPAVFVRIREKLTTNNLTGNNCNQPNTTTTGAWSGPVTLTGNNCNQSNKTTMGGIGLTGNRYWVGGTGTWDGTDTSHWSDISGGASGASVPTSTNDVFFDSNSNTGTSAFTVSVLTTAGNCRDLKICTLDGAMTLYPDKEINIYGNITCPATNFSLQFNFVNINLVKASGSATIDLHGGSNLANLRLRVNGDATFTLTNHLDVGTSLNLTKGTLDFANYDVRIGGFGSTGNDVRTLYLRNSNIYSGNVNVSGNNFTLDCGNSTWHQISSTFGWSGSYRFWILDCAADFSNIWVSGTHTFHDLTRTSAINGVGFLFDNGATFEALTISGTSGNLVRLGTNNGTNQWTCTVTSGVVDLDYLNLSYSTATGGAVFYAGSHSTNGGNNINWNFADPVYVTLTGNSVNQPNTSTTGAIEAFEARYWVGGAGTWDASSTTHWSASSGGGGGASVPNSATNVFFNGSSDTGTGFTVTLSGTIACRNWTVENHDVTITFDGSPTLSVYKDIRWIPVSTNISASGLSGTCKLVGGAGASQSILFNNITVGLNLRFDGTSTTTYNFASDFTGNSNSVFTLINGILNTANYTLSVDHWTTSAGTSTTNLGSSLIIISGWQGLNYVAGSTINAGTSTVRFTTTAGVTGNITLPNYTLNNIEFPSTSKNDFIINQDGGNLNCNNLSITNATNGRKYFILGSSTSVSGFVNLTIAGTFTVTGSSHKNCSVFIPNFFLYTSPTTISANAVSLSYVNFLGIAATGSAAPFSGTSIGNIGFNSGITFTTPKTTYFRGAAGTTVWDGSNVFSATSGGAGAEANYPLPQDTVIVDENTLSSTISSTSSNIRIEFSTFDASTRTTALTFSRNSAIFVGGQAGAIKTPAAITWTATGDGIYIHSDCDLDIVNALNTPITMRVRKQGTPSSGTVKLLRNLTHNSQYGLTNIGGTLDLNGFTLKVWNYTSGTIATTASNLRGLWIHGGAMQIEYSATFSIHFDCTYNLGHTFVDGEYVDLVGSHPADTIRVNGGSSAGLDNAPSIRLNGAYSAYYTSTTYYNSIDATNGSGSLTIGNSKEYYGDITLGSSVTMTADGTGFTFIGSKNSAINSNGVSFKCPITINKSVGYDVTLSSNVTITDGYNLYLTQGNISLSSYTFQVNRFSVTGTSSRTIKFDTGTIAVSENGTPWANSNATNLSITGQSTGKIKLLSTTGSSNFQGQGLSYPNLELAGAGDIAVTGANTFYNLTFSGGANIASARLDYATSIDNHYL